MKLRPSTVVVSAIAVLFLVLDGKAQSLNAPGNLVQQRISNKNQISWTDLSTGEINYEIGRSTGDGIYSTIAVLPANSITYNDASIDISLTYYYRVKAIGSTGESEFSYLQPLTPTAVSCGQSMCFPENCTNPYGSSQVIKTIQIPACQACVLDISFTRFDTEQNDILTVYDGNSITAPILGVFSGSQIPPELGASGRTLTLAFRPDLSVAGLGWELISNCVERPANPALLTSREIYSSEVTVQWSDNSPNETGFEIDRSTSPIFETVTTFAVPSNTSEFQAKNLDSLTTYYFRVRSVFGKAKSFNSNTLSVKTEKQPFRESALSFLMPENLSGVVKVSDMNNDKLYDLVVHQPLASDDKFHIKVFTNTGNKQFILKKDYTPADNGIINEIKIADMDNDRDLDIISCEYENVNVLFNNENDFNTQLAVKLPLYSSTGYGLLTGDYDSDGDNDLFVYNKSNTFAGWYRNNANYEFSFDSLSNLNKRFTEAQTVDFDNDGYLDLLVTEIVSNAPKTMIYFNRGGVYQPIEYYFLQGNFTFIPADVDSDGDYDLVINFINGIQIAKNNAGVFTLVESSLLQTGKLKNGTSGDIDNDGDIDLIFDSGFYTGSGGVTLINKGNYNFSVITNFTFKNETLNKLVEIVDWDNDADLDVIMIDQNSKAGTVWSNVMSQPNQHPNVPEQLSAIGNGSIVKLQWNSSIDDKTPTSGLRYNFFIGKTSDGEEVSTSDSHRDNGQLKRFDIHSISNRHVDVKNLENGDYFWGVQSLDGTQMTSLFATSTFRVTGSDFIKPPKKFKASPWSPYANDLSWEDASSDEQGFIVMRSLTFDKGYKIIATLPANTTSFRDSGLETFKAYCYRIAAIKGSATSELSPVVVCQTSPVYSMTYSKFVTTPEVKRATNGEMQWVDLNDDNRRDFIVVGEGFNGFFNTGTLEAYIQRDDLWYFDKLPINIIDNPSIQLIRISSVSSGDFDNDGDIDLLLGRTVSPSAIYQAQVVVLENQGNYTFNAMVIDQLTSAAMNAVRWGDFDNDGDLDILASTQDSFTHVYRNDGNHTFSNYFSPNFGGWAEWIDFNNDGLLDIAVSSLSFINGNNANFYLYRNTGIGFQLHDSFPTAYGKIKIADPDNDGDEDILTASATGTFKGFLENDRNANAFVSRDLDLPQTNSTSFAWVDFDNDNYTDVIRNTGVSTSLGIFPNKHGLHFEGEIHVPTSIEPEVSINDIDGDSDLDVISFSIGSSVNMLVYENNSRVIKLKPNPPTSLSIEQKNDSTIFKWDAAGTSLNQTFNAMIGTKPGKQDILNSMSDAENGFRKINEVGNTRYVTHKTIVGLKPGTYFWSVQAINQNYQGSAFAKAGSFAVGTPALLAPEIISATATSSRKIELLFANPTVDAKRIIYVSHDGIQFTALDSVSTNQYFHSGLESGNTYYYRIVLSDGTHYSPFSNTVQATTFSRPQITGITPTQSNEDEPITISLAALSANHAPGYPDNYQLLIGAGDNYEVNSDQSIQPGLNFNGTLTVPITIASQSDTSGVYLISITVVPVNDLPSSFSLQSPSDGSIIETNSLISFTWEEATDVDGDPVKYSVLVTVEGSTLVFDKINTHTLELDLINFPALWNKEVQWKVVADDAKSDTNSKETFSFLFTHILTAIDESSRDEFIYPNPAEESLVVSNPNHNVDMCLIQDTKGMQVVLVQTNPTSDGVVVDVSTLPAGVYIIQVLTPNNDTKKRYRFVKK